MRVVMECGTPDATCVPCHDERHGVPCCRTHCRACRRECEAICGRCGGPGAAGAAGLCRSCVDEDETAHERAHAGISEPDDCDRGPSCPQMGGGVA